jgi:geranylgeranyl transferase type-2 subunit alpha
LTSKVLNLNPEYYTVWNQRRRVLQHLIAIPQQPTSTDAPNANAQDLLGQELQFLLPLLMKFPKCYWIWNHRYWVLKQISGRLPLANAQNYWDGELVLVGKMLGRDSRNFHGWDYRRFVIQELRRLQETARSVGKEAETPAAADSVATSRTQDGPTSETITESEFAYTTKMIKSNLSNFSAWHNRSKLIPQLLDERKANDTDRRQLFDEELAFIQSAVFTDPYDQSLWYYHHFLMSEVSRTDEQAFVKFTDEERAECIRAEIEAVRDLLEDTDDCKWVYQSLLMYSAQLSKVAADDGLVTSQDSKSWLLQLRKLDPMRSKRWDDWEQSLGIP